MRSALPDAFVDAPDHERSRRDRIVDAVTYVLAFAIGAAGFADAWEQHPPWLRAPAIVIGIATLVALRWRRGHPGAVGIGIGVIALVVLPASGTTLAATFNAAIRARGRDLAIIVGLVIAWAFVNPLIYPPRAAAPAGGAYWADASASLPAGEIVTEWIFWE